MRPAPEAAAALCVSGPDSSANLEEKRSRISTENIKLILRICNGGQESPVFRTENVLQTCF